MIPARISRPQGWEAPSAEPAAPRPRLVAPVAVALIDLDTPLTDLALQPGRANRPYGALMFVARLGGRPVGSVTVAVPGNGIVSIDAQARALDEQLGSVLSEASLDLMSGNSARAAHEQSASVVIATCRNPGPLERCLRSILACRYGRFEVIVVENRPEGGETRSLLAERFAHDPRVRYVEEPRRGASRARNAGLARATGEIVVFTDDDVVVDEQWIARLADGFEAGPDVGCVTGLILPLELETESQVLLEELGGFGRGFRPRTYRLPAARADDPLAPYAAGAFGSGANAALRADVVRRLGGFDTTLGPGTPGGGGEDLDLFVRVLLSGAALAYQPAAMLWHEHPRTMSDLRRRAYSYGVGMTAMLTKHLVRGPERAQLLRLVPAGIRYVRDPASRKNAKKGGGFPRRLTQLERIGMLVGPAAYITSALRPRAIFAGASPAPAASEVCLLTEQGVCYAIDAEQAHRGARR